MNRISMGNVFFIFLLLLGTLAHHQTFAQANQESANYFIQTCGLAEHAPIECTIRLVGIFEGIYAQSAITGTKPLFCPSENVTYGQEMSIARKYLRDHPEVTNQDLSLLVYVALMRAFPCAPLSKRTPPPTPAS